jgi:hypothetical protein
MEHFSAPNPAEGTPLDAAKPRPTLPPSGTFAAPDSAAVQPPPAFASAPQPVLAQPVLAQPVTAPPAPFPVLTDALPSNRPRRGILVAGMAAMAVAAVAAGAFVVTRDSGDIAVVENVIVEDATELATDSNAESTVGYSFSAATASAQTAASVVFDMEINSPDGPISATASFDRPSGRTTMDLDMSQVVADDEFIEVGDSLSFVIDEPTQVAFVRADFFAAIFGPTDAGWISLTSDEFSIDDDVFGDVLTNPLNIAEVFGDVEPTDLGEETIDGEVLRHFEVVLDDAAIAELGDDGLVTEDLAQSEFDLTYEVWVDESNQIRRILFDAIDEGEVGSVDMWITISSDPIDIALPSPDDVVDIEELFGSAFEDFAIDETVDNEED